MALINCPECGKEISSKAVACPFCGAPVEVGQIPVHIWRKKTRIGGTAITGKMFIDGKEVGSAGNGVDLIVKVPEGNHQLTVDSEVRGAFLSSQSHSLNFSAVLGQQVEIELVIKLGASGLFLSGCGSIYPELR